MIFPDQSHINRVRDALWQRYGNGASIMIGSGFSRNAVPIRPNAGIMPTWGDVTDHFFEELYPDDGDNRGGDLRIAQEYRTAFGRTALHDTLQRLIRDEEFRPSPLHERMLELPWQDIFTTNWDTLLERTRSSALERHYSVITRVDEIPMARKPRIMKLHGSLPSQFPLIVTEEDYRTYPTKFAPFVNTVQQAMMETVLCLIGFSGDDPNFLSWSGWVRDNLGASAPKIYLAGFLNLSQHQRRMLESRNVVPIDLALHPQQHSWPPDLKHRYATEWLLHTLEEGRPYNVADWPTLPPRKKNNIPDQLLPVAQVDAREPLPEPSEHTMEGEDPVQAISTITEIWRHNRLIYPGWLTLPDVKRAKVSLDTDSWEWKMLQSLKVLSPIESLLALRELIWREEILLMPMYPQLETAVEGVLSLIDCERHTIDAKEQTDMDWRAVREAWRNTAAALVTAARYRSDRDAFEQRVEALSPFEDEDEDIRHRIRHERCLWAIFDSDFQLLNRLLSEWPTENCDPIWMMRKAAVLWEVGHSKEALELLELAIAETRQIPAHDSNVAPQSREAWAMLCWGTINMIDLEHSQTARNRLRELEILHCNVFDERRAVSDEVEPDKPEEEPPPFEMDRRRGTAIRIGHDPQAAAYQAGYRAVQLSEIAGLPSHILVAGTGLRGSVWGEVMKKAAEKLADVDLRMAVGLVQRVCSGDNDKTLGRVMSLTRMANLPTDEAEDIAQACLRTIDHFLANIANTSDLRRVGALIETLSRLVVRINPESVDSILDRAVAYCQNPQLASGTDWSGVEHLLERCWSALPEERRHSKFIDLLNTPIAGLDDPSPLGEYEWPDPAEVLRSTTIAPDRTDENDDRWQTCVDLVVRGLRGGAAARLRASRRIAPLTRSDRLTELEALRIAEALWNEPHTEAEGLPQGTGLHEWAFLILPEPSRGLARERFLAKWLPLSGELNEITYQTEEGGYDIEINVAQNMNTSSQYMSSCLWQIGHAIENLRRLGQGLNLSDAHRERIAYMVEAWAEASTPELELPDHILIRDHLKQRARTIADALPAVLGEIALSEDTGEKFYRKMQYLNENGVPAFGWAASLSKIVPERFADITTSLRIGMTSRDSATAASAATGLRMWLEAAARPDAQIPGPPEDLIREIGIAVATRRQSVLPGALLAAQWIFESGTQTERDCISGMVLDGLTCLATELRYNRDHENLEEIPLLRLFTTQLVVAMSKAGLDQHPSVDAWLQMAKEDPLPEIRRAARE